MVRQVLQTGLNVEMEEYLGYEPYAPEGRGSGSNRNASCPKTVMTEIGQVQIEMRRHRLGTFTPTTIPKQCGRVGWAVRCREPRNMGRAIAEVRRFGANAQAELRRNPS